MTFAAWWALCLTCLVGAASPGPSLAVVLSHRGAQSVIPGLACAWAHALGVGIYGLLTAFGLALVIQQSESLFTLIQVAGALYLLHIAYRIATGKSGFSGLPDNHSAVWVAMKDGFLVSILNPKLIVFFTALFSQFVTETLTTSERFTMAFIAMVIDGAWYSLVTMALGQRAIRLFDTHARKVDLAFAIVLTMLSTFVILRVFVNAI